MALKQNTVENENLGMYGRYIIKAKDVQGNPRGLWLIENVLTQINADVRMKMLQGTATGYTWDHLQIRYLAFGTGTTPATHNDTRLVSEQFRKPITQQVQINATTVQTIVNLLAEESNFLIREIGVFCGPSANSAPNSGVLLSRVNTNIDKNSNLVLNVIRHDVVKI